jgi:hypothetical protein
LHVRHPDFTFVLLGRVEPKAELHGTFLWPITRPSKWVLLLLLLCLLTGPYLLTLDASKGGDDEGPHLPIGQTPHSVAKPHYVIAVAQVAEVLMMCRPLNLQNPKAERLKGGTFIILSSTVLRDSMYNLSCQITSFIRYVLVTTTHNPLPFSTQVPC